MTISGRLSLNFPPGLGPPPARRRGSRPEARVSDEAREARVRVRRRGRRRRASGWQKDPESLSRVACKPRIRIMLCTLSCVSESLRLPAPDSDSERGACPGASG
eukprot:3228367-Rhodomonas_salina.1